MWYKIDFTKLVVQLLPPILRSGFMINLLRIMIIPLRYVYEKFYLLHTNVSVKLNTTCNVMYLEKALNDAFFLKGSQIFISTPEEVKDGIFFHLRNEVQPPKPLYRLSEQRPCYLNINGEKTAIVHMIVHVPTFLCTSTDKDEDKYGGRNYNEIKNILNIYKPAGRTFSIELYDYE